MTTETDLAMTEPRIVVIFDICSSTDVLEDLNRTDNVVEWRNFLIWAKNYLRDRAKKFSFDLNNFTGDGWLLLFDNDASGKNVFEVLTNFCRRFEKRFNEKIRPILEAPPDVVGMTFGMDRGRLLKVRMNQRNEYVGRV